MDGIVELAVSNEVDLIFIGKSNSGAPSAIDVTAKVVEQSVVPVIVVEGVEYDQSDNGHILSSV